MSLSINADSTTLSDDVIAMFESDARATFALLDSLRDKSGIPETEIDLLLTDDLATTVLTHQKGTLVEDPEFSPHRLGGTVAGKNLPLTADHGKVCIVIDSSLWQPVSNPNGSFRFHQICLLAHELTHPILNRGRYCSGALDGVIYPSFTGTEIAHSLTRILADEYRADRLADIYIRQFASAEIDGQARPVGVWEASGEDQVASAASCVSQAHPLWPDIVQDYRVGSIDLSTMWRDLISNMEQTLTSLIHAQAARDGVDEHDRMLLDEDPMKKSPARTLYFDPVKRLVELVRSQPILPTLHESKQLDKDLIDAGERMFVEIWDKLGLSIELQGDRKWSLWVKEPLR